MRSDSRAETKIPGEPILGLTGGLAPNRFQKPLGMRRKPFKSDLS
jgi:hypothetical protein